LENIVCFLEANEISIKSDFKTKIYQGLATFRDQVFKVVDTEKVFSSEKEKYNHYILMRIAESQILIPVYQIKGIFESDQIDQITINPKKFNFLVKNEEEINILVENYFFD
jgi:chemotaxis signal transduction protein